MPELVDKEAPAACVDPFDTLLDTLERMQRAIGVEVRTAARGVVGSSRQLLERWAEMCKEVAAGQTKQVHDQRDSFLCSLRSRTARLERLRALLREGGSGAAEADELLVDITALKKLHTRLSSRWQTSEDLETLAVEDYPLSGGRLKAIVASHPPPQEWYDE